MKNKNKALAVAKINLGNIKLAVTLTAIVVGTMVVQDIVMIIIGAAKGSGYYGSEGNMNISLGNYLFLLIILGAIFIPSRNFRRITNLGGKRDDFFFGSALAYVIMTAAVSLVCVVLFYTYDRLMVSLLYNGGTLDILYWFGWIANGPVVAFFQQFSFLLLLAVVIHTLTAAQDKWYGWAADVLIVAIISVFSPIPVLRAALVWFFYMIIFSASFVQITSCLILSAAIYMLNKPIFTRKAI